MNRYLVMLLILMFLTFGFTARAQSDVEPNYIVRTIRINNVSALDIAEALGGKTITFFLGSGGLTGGQGSYSGSNQFRGGGFSNGFGGSSGGRGDMSGGGRGGFGR